MDKGMMKKMMELLSEKEGPMEMSEDDMKTGKMAKMEVLKELIEMAAGKAGEGIMSGMQEVKVAAPNKEGLIEGLEKAEEVVKEAPEMSMEDNEEESMAEEMASEKKDEEEEDDEY